MKKSVIIGVVVLILVLTLGVGFYFFNKSTNSNSEATSQNSGTNTSPGVSKCEQQYQSLLAKFGQKFDDCKADVKKSSSCDKSPNDGTPVKQKNVVLIFDSSGSMNSFVGGKKKIDVAKSSVSKFIDSLDSNTNVSIIVYGHKGSNRASDKAASCQGIEEVYYMGPLNATVAKGKLAGFQPTGWTPIAASLEKAKAILGQYSQDKNDNMVILVSDGQETCDGDPVAKAKELLDSNLKVVTNVVGFDVAGDDEKKLQAISSSGGGKFFSVHNEQEFDNAFKENKNFMAGFDCYMEQSDVWVGNKLDVNEQRDKCMNRLDMDEKHEIEMSAKVGDEGSTPDCRDYIIQTYSKRYDQIKGQIDAAYNAGTADTEKEKTNLKDANKKMDENEGIFQDNE